MRPSVRFSVSPDLEQNLRNLAKLTRKDVVIEALTAGGEVIAEEAKRLVKVVSGNLRDSIGVSINEQNSAGGQSGKGHFNVFIGPRTGGGEPHDGFYGHMIERGTFRFGAQPFMAPAFDTMGEEAGEVAIDHIRAEFTRLTKRA
ncbi:MAG: hypothetical protein B7X90_01790 [Novosphingobium sp. 17-62-19]|uniref:HK97-gp10 family putative phage morphogenesis protein n=1 Tax=Novosphingobium sp. 17-62-19 TaxID=1970406 RepID=UPI000BC3E29E|nr:HK97-gp10 family putative phage morphogenesis protein [Novosphingobium sp. 17-62-19]OZA21369.1 MAG: hypothetical protein B7X90_01790 [Novosphingobium sp. 17-62-19]HQS95086.1 HK97 gp10 family phage protein [Novosphingobium sp.]